MKRKGILNAVYGNELTDLLTNIGLYNKVVNGKVKCKFCHSVLDLNNVHAVFVEEKQIKMVCKQEICLESFYQFMENKKYG